MINRILIFTCLIALFIILALNFIPTFWDQSLSTYIRQDSVSGMAVKYKGRLFTLNYDQQKESIELLNRSIPMGKAQKSTNDPKVEFDEIVIYRFVGDPIVIKPLAWVDRSLYFEAPEWSKTDLMDISKGQLYQIFSDSYDKKPYN